MINTTLGSETIFDAIGRLKPLPMSVSRLVELTGSPDVGLDEVADVVRFDPILSSDVLQKSNSPMYAGRQRITEVTQAAGRLGISEVLTIAMSRAMQGQMAAPLPQYGFDADRLWLHSLTTSIAAEAITRTCNRPGLASASVVGLIHDVGKLVLAECVPASTLMGVRAQANDEGRPVHEIETERFGMHHGDIGGKVARVWGFPLVVQVAIIGHHPPQRADDPLSIALRAANAIAHEMESYRQNPDHEISEEPTKLVGRLGLPSPGMKPLYDRIVESLDSALAAYT